MIRTILFAICIVFLGALKIRAQVTEEWVSRYNGPGNWRDFPTDLAIDGSGNVVVTGTSWRGLSTREDIVTIKYSSNGDTLWVRRYNGPGSGEDVARALAIDSSGNVCITGSIWVSYDVGFSYVTLKYDYNGNLLWSRRYDGPENEYFSYLYDAAYDVAVDNFGNVFVTGSSMDIRTRTDYATIKYDSNGNTIWVRRFNGWQADGSDIPHAMVVDNSGNVYVTGSSQGDCATIKYNNSGDILWERWYDGSGNGIRATALALDTFGNLYITGEGYSAGTYSDYATIKYSSDGNFLWVSLYDGPENYNDRSEDLAIDGSGNVYVTGFSWGGNPNVGTHYDYTTIKYSSNGDSLWVRRYNGTGNIEDKARAIALDDSGNVYVTGTSEGLGSGPDYATIKYDSVGDIVWVTRYNGTGINTDQANAIDVDNSGNVYVTGWSLGIGTNFDFATIKYSQGVGIEEESELRIPQSELKLFQNLPNPFHHSTIIRYTLPVDSRQQTADREVSLNIYDISGRLVKTLVDEKQNPGIYKIQWEGKDHASGIYYYRLTARGLDESSPYIDTKKLIFLR